MNRWFFRLERGNRLLSAIGAKFTYPSSAIGAKFTYPRK